MNELLPVGSIVLLEGGTKKTVIMGILQMNEENPGQVYDYLGVPYPEGYMGQGSSYLFKHENIAEVIWRGYEDEDRAKMMNFLEKMVKQADAAVNENMAE